MIMRDHDDIRNRQAIAYGCIGDIALKPCLSNQRRRIVEYRVSQNAHAIGLNHQSGMPEPSDSHRLLSLLKPRRLYR